VETRMATYHLERYS